MAGQWTKSVTEHHCIKPSGFSGKNGAGSIWTCECGREFEVVGRERNPDYIDPREPYELNVWREVVNAPRVLGGYRD